MSAASMWIPRPSGFGETGSGRCLCPRSTLGGLERVYRYKSMCYGPERVGRQSRPLRQIIRLTVCFLMGFTKNAWIYPPITPPYVLRVARFNTDSLPLRKLAPRQQLAVSLPLGRALPSILTSIASIRRRIAANLSKKMGPLHPSSGSGQSGTKSFAWFRMVMLPAPFRSECRSSRNLLGPVTARLASRARKRAPPEPRRPPIRPDRHRRQ